MNYIAQLDLLVSPDNDKSIIPILLDKSKEVVGFYSHELDIVYPVIEDIIILMPLLQRDIVMEEKYLLMMMDYDELNHLIALVVNTIQLLRQNNLNSSWVAEEADFWNHHYKSLDSIESSNWNERLFQREYMLPHIPQTPSCKVILDIGCGEGQNFIKLFSNHIVNQDTLYIALDASYSALKSNKKHNKHNNKLFILGDAGFIPVIHKSVTHLFLFGVLHHTELKEKLLLQINKYLVDSGVVLLVEPVVSTQEAQQQLIHKIKSEGISSPYEERLVEWQLMEIISQAYDVDYMFKYQWVFYNFLSKRFDVLSNNKRLHNLLLYIDHYLGVITKFMPQKYRSHEIMAILINKFK